MQPTHLRQQYRQTACTARNALTPAQKQQAEQAIHLQLCDLLVHLNAQTIALYLATTAEVDTQAFIRTAAAHPWQLAVPVMHPFSKPALLFIRYDATTVTQPNRFGIQEPSLQVSHVIPITQIDTFIMPLTAFDAGGQRLGMGMGCYDRTLAHYPSWQPHRIGLAFGCQQVQRLPVAAWDVPLTHVVTEHKTFTFASMTNCP
jgi:5-formyltetrahydrofolate cyclo-ligase